MAEHEFDTGHNTDEVVQQTRNRWWLNIQRPSGLALSLYLLFSLSRASFLLSQLSGSDPRLAGADTGMVGTGVLGEVAGGVEVFGRVSGYAALWGPGE